MAVDVEPFLESLRGSSDWRKQEDQIRRWAEEGEASGLVALASALQDTEVTSSLSQATVWYLLDFIERTLATTTGLPFAEGALNVRLQREATKPLSSRERRAENLAARLAMKQTSETLRAVFVRYGDDPRCFEILTELAMEAGMHRLADDATDAFWQGRVLPARHPLAWLPLALTAAERVDHLYRTAFQSLGDCQWTESAAPARPASPSFPRSVEWTELPVSEAESARIATAVEIWCRESSARTEIRQFQSRVPIPHYAVTPALLQTLPLDCFADATESTLVLAGVSTGEVLSRLLSAACSGGAFSYGYGRAFARLSAWRTLGAMAGNGEDDPIEAVTQQADRCHWFLFSAKSAWYYNIVWDVGFLALRPDQRTLVVLAATDTD